LNWRPAARVASGTRQRNELEMNPEFTKFMENCCRDLAREVPEFPTHMGMFEIAGEPAPQSYFTGIDPDSKSRRQDLLGNISRNLLRFSSQDLDETERISAGVLGFLTDYAYERGLVGTQGKDFLEHEYLVQPAVGLQSELPLFLSELHPMRHAGDAEDYVSRLKAIADQLGEAGRQLAGRQDKGLLPPALVLDGSVEEIQGFLESSHEENVLYRTLVEKTEQLPGLSDHARSNLLSDAISELQKNTYPAYRELLNTLEGLRGKAGDAPGVWQLPDGERWYEFLLRSATTTSLSAEEIHQLGLEETERLEQDMIRACRDMGIAANTITDCHRALDEKKGAPLEDNEENRQAIVRQIEDLMLDIESRLPHLFHRLPRSEVTVKTIPRFAEGSRNQSYQPPSLDGSRAGFFELNVSQMLDQSSFELPIVVYHEIFPGHHLQISLAQENPELPSLRRIITFDAYIEGWAKYAETIPERHGINNDPMFRLARMRRELISTINLALDTGIHSKRWSVEQAMQFFDEHSGMGETFARYIVNRSASVPAQMCSYKIGMMKMQEQREKMERALGPSFDPRDFHDTVLRHGSVPLDMLETIVDHEIAKLKKNL
jgi:uncharacterized protein (DUF885 family)